MKTTIKKPRPPVSELYRRLDYDPATGVFRWKIRVSQRSQTGAIAGSKTNHGYIAIPCGGGVSAKAHRIAMAMHLGEWPEHEVDHINGDRADNRLENLRLATHSENRCNVRGYKNNTSGFKGVIWHKKRWVAQISKDGRHKHIGCFSTREAAAEAYKQAAAALHGEFANTEGRAA